MLDLNADRIHPQKKNRLLASGRLGIPDALLLIIAFFTVAVILAIAISFKFLIILMAYFIISLLYSLVFKKITLCDVFTLAMLYSIRVFAGGVVMGIALSFWLIAFSAFIFLSLAFVKRYSELMLVNNETDLIISTDLGSLQIMGIASGFMAAIVFALYINSAEVIKLYKTPLLLWPISFLILFWINSIWLVTARGKMHVDPVVYAIKDPISYLMFFIAGVLLFAAAAYPF
jgi:4-hydroxybenzoate polyprenyltransferase